MANTNSSSQITSGHTEFYTRVVLEHANVVLVHDRYGQQRPIPTKNSKQIKWKRYGLSATASSTPSGVIADIANNTAPLTEGVAPDGKFVTEAPLGNRKDIRNAVEAAHKADGWSGMTGHGRARQHDGPVLQSHFKIHKIKANKIAVIIKNGIKSQNKIARKPATRIKIWKTAPAIIKTILHKAPRNLEKIFEIKVLKN